MTESATTQESPEKKESIIPRKYVWWGLAGALAIGLIVLLVVFFIGRSFPVTIDVIRDLFVIALVLEACVFGVVLIVFLLMVIRLINTVEYEVRPILDKTQQIVGTAQNTSDFVSDNIVKPTVKARSTIAGARAGVKALTSEPKKNLPK